MATAVTTQQIGVEEKCLSVALGCRWLGIGVKVPQLSEAVVFAVHTRSLALRGLSRVGWI